MSLFEDSAATQRLIMNLITSSRQHFKSTGPWVEAASWSFEGSHAGLASLKMAAVYLAR